MLHSDFARSSIIIMKRFFLFIVTNLLVIVSISIIASVFNLQPYLTQYGIDYFSLAIFCSLWGMMGAFISLLLSKVMAKAITKLTIIQPRQAQGKEAMLVKMVHELSTKARLPNVPEVGIYNANEVNAFATGPSKRNSLVAVSSGLLASMNQDELKGVLAHEISHIANGDMVTLTLIQGIVNSFSLFLARVVSYFITSSMREESSYMVRFGITFILDIFFSMLGSMVVAAFSRKREFRADIGGARLAGTQSMINALQSLTNYAGERVPQKSSLNALKISDKGGFLTLFSTHPPLEQRISVLRSMLRTQ